MYSHLKVFLVVVNELWAEAQDHSDVRIENDLADTKGNQVRLKEGAPVEVTMQAKEKDTLTKHF